MAGTDRRGDVVSLVLPHVGALAATLLFWGWACWICAGDWRFNPQYSYGWFVPLLCIYFLFENLKNTRFSSVATVPCEWCWRSVLAWVGFGFTFVFLTEMARQEKPELRPIMWVIALAAVGLTLYAARKTGGVALFKKVFFPSVFFLVAVPWPLVVEEPATKSLMPLVAAFTQETLHFMGVPSVAQGEIITLRGGMVGVSEACSGLRSLQAALMVALATGEGFVLGRMQRVALVCLGLVLAFIGNCARSLFLCLYAESNGVQAIGDVHDGSGLAVLWAVTALIGLAAWLFSRQQNTTAASAVESGSSLEIKLRPMPQLVFFVAAGLAGWVLCHLLYWIYERDARPQQHPYFACKAVTDSKAEKKPVPPEVWANLRPTAGYYLHYDAPSLRGGKAKIFHFYWRPTARNRVAFVHRPDVCMSGGGWSLRGEPEVRTIPVSGVPVEWYFYRFERNGVRVLQLWGVWRDGRLVNVEEPLRLLSSPADLASYLASARRRFGVEVVGVFLPYGIDEPQLDFVSTLINNIYRYERTENNVQTQP